MRSKEYALRVSVLDRCQLRCGYCLPDNSSKKASWLTIEQYEKIAQGLSHFNINKIRFTGGEPLIRPELGQIIKIFKINFPKSPLALTTNGLLFKTKATEIYEAGLRKITFHIDTLNEQKYKKIMGKGNLYEVLANIEFAKTMGFAVKLNIVVQKNLNFDELEAFLNYSKNNQVQVRFIEMMNTGSAKDFVAQEFVSGQEILTKVENLFGLKKLERENASDPAELFLAIKINLMFGLIASDSRPFCSNCNRLRLSAEGKLYSCLYEEKGVDLVNLASRTELAELIALKIKNKKSYNPSLSPKPRRLFSMAHIGG